MKKHTNKYDRKDSSCYLLRKWSKTEYKADTESEQIFHQKLIDAKLTYRDYVNYYRDRRKANLGKRTKKYESINKPRFPISRSRRNRELDKIEQDKYYSDSGENSYKLKYFR